MGIGTGLARAYTGAQSIARQREEAEAAKREQEEQAAIQRIAAELALSQQGVVKQQDVKPIVSIPGMPGAMGATPVFEPGRYETLGDTGRVLDRQRTPEGRQVAVKAALEQRAAQKRQQEIATRAAALKGHPLFKHATPELIEQVAGDDGAFRSALGQIGKPEERKPYQPSTRAEMLADYEDKARIDARHRPPKDPKEPEKPEKLQEGERRGGALLTMARDAAQVLRGATAPGRMQAMAARVGLNEAVDANRQVLNQAASQLVSSYLYLVSGATATDEEVQRRALELVPQPGDKPAVIVRKKAALETMLRAMEIAAGRGAEIVNGGGQFSPNNPFAPKQP